MPIQQARTEKTIAQVLLAQTRSGSSSKLIEAMHYATLSGGKRLRALLVYATGQAMGIDAKLLDTPACAVELIHAYSLVHDDLPCMDNDELRRGRPTCHKAFGEATALLTGDALQSLAFELLASQPFSPQRQLEMIKTLAHNVGVWGMAGGQAIDLESVDKHLDLEQLQNMHTLKTGALIQASVELGALCSEDVTSQSRKQLNQFAHCIGLAFQVQDDVLDVVTDTATLGKTQGADIAMNKPTYPALLGLEVAQQKAHSLIEQAMTILVELPYDTQTLTELARYIVQRKH